jgi:hypothetical protein
MQYPAQEINICTFNWLGREEIMRHEFDPRALMFRGHSVVHYDVLHYEV